jgi:hypothetical protein
VTFVSSGFPVLPSAYHQRMLGALFGSAHVAGAPATFVAHLGTHTGALYSSSLFVNIPNDDAHWTLATDATGAHYGYTNVLPIVFPGLTSYEIANWDYNGLSVRLADASGVTIITAIDLTIDTVPYLLNPTLGQVVRIAPQRLLFGLT